VSTPHRAHWDGRSDQTIAEAKRSRATADYTAPGTSTRHARTHLRREHLAAIHRGLVHTSARESPASDVAPRCIVGFPGRDGMRVLTAADFLRDTRFERLAFPPIQEDCNPRPAPWPEAPGQGEEEAPANSHGHAQTLRWAVAVAESFGGDVRSTISSKAEAKRRQRKGQTSRLLAKWVGSAKRNKQPAA